MLQIEKEQQFVLSSLQSALGLGSSFCDFSSINWMTVESTAQAQGVMSLLYCGVMNGQAQVPKPILQTWRKRAIAGVVRNEFLMDAQTELVKAFEQRGIPAAILKGSSASRLYPTPELRQLGDIDVLVRKENLTSAVNVLSQQGYVENEGDHAFHICFNKEGIHLELHHVLSKIPDSVGGKKAQAESEACLKHAKKVFLGMHGFYVLSEPHQALSLLLHMERHMIDAGIGLRQLCDWAAFIAKTDSSIFVNATIPLLKQCGLYQFAKVATKACVMYLGVSQKLVLWCAHVDESLCDAFMIDVFRSGNMGAANEVNMHSLFTDKSALGKQGRNTLKETVTVLNQRIYQYFPCVKKCKFLLPMYWIIVPIRYVIRAWRNKRSVTDVLKTEKRRNTLYKELKLFEVEN